MRNPGKKRSIKALFVAGAMLAACSGAPVLAGQGTAAISVGATVTSSCRVDAASQVGALSSAGLPHHSRCSGDTRPATRAVVETERPRLSKVSIQSAREFSVEAPDGSRSAWVRLDVIY